MIKKENKENGIINKILIATIVLLLVILLIPAIIEQEKEINIYNTGQENLNLLSVSSFFEKEFSPNEVEIRLSIITLNENTIESQQENAKITQAVKDAIKSAGVRTNQIETTDYRINQQYEWDGVLRKNVLRGYQTTNTIKITLSDLTKTGSVIDAAINAGANRVTGIQFGLSDELKRQAQNEVLKEAGKLAKIKAQNIASGLGISVGKVYSVSENYNYYAPFYRNFDMYTTAMDSVESYETPISPSNIKINATLNVQFEI